MSVLLLIALLGLLPGSLQSGPGDIENPCTPEARNSGHFHHPYPPDQSKYIQCTEWGNYHLMSCYSGVWDSETFTCKYNSHYGNGGGNGQSMTAGTNYAGFDNGNQGGNGGNQAVRQNQPGNGGSNQQFTQKKPQDGNPKQWLGSNVQGAAKPQDGLPSHWFVSRNTGTQGGNGANGQVLPQDGHPIQWFGNQGGNNQAPQGNNQAPQGNNQAPQGNNGQVLPQDGHPIQWFGYQGGNNQAPQGTNQAPQGNNQAPQGNNQAQWPQGGQTQNARADMMVQGNNPQQAQSERRPVSRIVGGTVIRHQPYQESSNTVINTQTNNGQKSYQHYNPQGSSGQKGVYHTLPPPTSGQKGTYNTAPPTQRQNGAHYTPAPPVYNTPAPHPPSNGKSHGTGQKSAKSYIPGSYKSHGDNSGKSVKSPTGKSSQEWVKTVHAGKSTTGTNNNELYNPCRDTSTRYLTHQSGQSLGSPSNPFKYYECVNGQAQERDCPTDHVWIQRDEQCKSLKPSQGGSPFQNPCEGSERYLPYPEDSARYIECIGWSRQEVRQCPAAHVWSQAHQMCLPDRVGQPQQPQQPPPQQPPQQPQQPPQQPGGYQKGQTMITASPSATDTIPSDFCINSDSFYHAYPPSPTMYIQCDEFGAMYLRFCGPGKHWDDSVKTCMGDESGTDQKGDTAAVNYIDYSNGNGANNADYDHQVAPTSANTFGKINTDKTPEPFFCPEGTEWLASQVRCVSIGNTDTSVPGDMECPPGTVWLDTVHGCLDLSRGTNIINQVIRIDCPEAFTFDLDSGECRGVVAGGDSQSPDCHMGYLWDVQMAMCIQQTGTGMVLMNDASNGVGGDVVRTMYGPSLRGFKGPDESQGMANQGTDNQGYANGMMPPQHEKGLVYFGNGNNGAPVDNGNGMGNNMGYSGGQMPASNGMVYANNMPASNGMPPSGNGRSYSDNPNQIPPSGNQMPSSNAVASSNGMVSGANGGMVLTDQHGSPVHTNAHQGQGPDNTIIPVSVSDNPCDTGEGFYHAYPSDPRYFIQCDESGAMFVHACGYSLVWDQELMTCVPWSVMLSTPGADHGMPGAAKEGRGEDGDYDNPCINSDRTFFHFPYNQYLYIMCMGSQPYVMPCSVGLIWDNDITTCVKPQDTSNLLVNGETPPVLNSQSDTA